MSTNPAAGQPHFFPRSSSQEEVCAKYVSEGWITNDVRDEGYRRYSHLGAFSELDFISEEQIRKHPYYQQFLRPFGLCWSAVIKISNGQEECSLSLQRTFAQGPFSPEEMGSFVRLSSVLTNVVKTTSIFGVHGLNTALRAFEACGAAAMLFDRFGSVTHMNNLANSILGDDIQVRRGRLYSYDSNASLHVDLALRGLVEGQDTDNNRFSVILPRKSRLPVLIYLSRLHPVVNDVFRSAIIAGVLVDLDQKTDIEVSVLEEAFGLTPSQAKLAALLSQGVRAISL